MTDKLDWLQKWYSSNCVESWPEYYGVKIETIDNPGWGVWIDLIGTSVEGLPFEEYKNSDRSESNWAYCTVENNRFIAAGGVNNLDEILDVFINWVDRHTNQ